LGDNDQFGAYSTSTTTFGGTFCSTTKTYNTQPPGGGSINIIEWDTVNKVFKATFSFKVTGEDAGKSCTTPPNPPVITPLPVPTDMPNITEGQVWMNYITSP
jgi:hypothetical protein